MSPDQGYALVSSLTSLRLCPAPTGKQAAGGAYPNVACSLPQGDLQSEVKEEGWRSQLGGHERRRLPCGIAPAKSLSEGRPT